MAVVLLGGGFKGFDDIQDVLKSASAICFPKVPDPIFFGDGFVQHVTVSPTKLDILRQFANESGLYVLTDRFGAQRQGPLRENERFII